MDVLISLKYSLNLAALDFRTVSQTGQQAALARTLGTSETDVC